jgi:hypothetical protein
MKAWWRKSAPEEQVFHITTRALDSRNMQLLRTTLAVLRLPETWQYDADATDGVVLVDIDTQEGKAKWRELLAGGRYYRVVPLTRNNELRQFANGLAKPLRAKPLEDLLRELGSELSSLAEELNGDEDTAARQLLLCEAMVQSPHDRFGVHLPDGHWFYVERDKDRLYAAGGLDSLLDSLFRPLHRGAIKPVKLRPESFVSGPSSESYSLSLLLWSAVQSREEAANLRVLKGDRYFSVIADMPWNKLPHGPDQKVLLDYLKANGPVDLVSLVLEVGMSPQRLMSCIAGAWLLGVVKAEVATPGHNALLNE